MYDDFTFHSNMYDINVDNESHVVFIEDNVIKPIISITKNITENMKVVIIRNRFVIAKLLNW